MSTYSAMDMLTDLRAIDSSYSLVAEANTLELPETLGENTLEYTPLTAAEVLAKAAKYFEADYIDKQFDINSQADNSIAKLEHKITAVQGALVNKISDITAECIEKCLTSRNHSIDNGIVNSSICEHAVSAIEEEYDNKKVEAQAVANAEVDIYQDEISTVEISQQQALDNLEDVRDAKIEEKTLEVEDDELAKQNYVTDYNNDVDVRETKYQYNRAKDIYDANNDERDRAVDIAELQLKLGDAGLADFIAQQKFAYAKSVVQNMSYTDAKYFLTSAISSHLGSYYSAFVDYVNNLD